LTNGGVRDALIVYCDWSIEFREATGAT